MPSTHHRPFLRALAILKEAYLTSDFTKALATLNDLYVLVKEAEQQEDSAFHPGVFIAPPHKDPK